MSARKKLTSVSFTTSVPMAKVMEIVGQLYEAGSVQNFHVEELELKKTVTRTAGPAPKETTDAVD